jgi:hypothetical protein
MVDQDKFNYKFSQSITTAEKGDTILCNLNHGEVFSFLDMNERIGIVYKTGLSFRG